MTDYTEDTVPEEHKETFWRQHLEAWKASGQTQRAYCQSQGLTTHRFTYWKTRFAAADKSVPTAQPGWQLLGHREMPSGDPQHVNAYLPNGIRLEVPVTAIELLPELLRQLEPLT